MFKSDLLHEPLLGQDLGSFGLDDVAYIKAVIVDGAKQYAIHAADGTHLTTVAERDVAFVTVRQHEMEAASVH